MYKMREGLEDYLKSQGFHKNVEANELNENSKVQFLKIVETCKKNNNTIDWEEVSLYMQLVKHVYPTGWQKLYKELISIN